MGQHPLGAARVRRRVLGQQGGHPHFGAFLGFQDGGSKCMEATGPLLLAPIHPALEGRPTKTGGLGRDGAVGTAREVHADLSLQLVSKLGLASRQEAPPFFP